VGNRFNRSRPNRWVGVAEERFEGDDRAGRLELIQGVDDFEAEGRVHGPRRHHVQQRCLGLVAANPARRARGFGKGGRLGRAIAQQPRQ